MPQLAQMPPTDGLRLSMNAAPQNRSFLVAQVGARMHYAVPRILFRNQRLARLYTDLYFPDNHWLRFLAKISPTKKVAGHMARYKTDIPDGRVRYSNVDGLAYKRELARARTPLACVHACIRAARRLASMVVRSEQNVSHLAIYGFETGSLELFTWAAPRGCKLVLEQCVAPRQTQKRVLRRLHADAGLPEPTDDLQGRDILEEREREEWRLAHQIICPSEFVMSELIAAGAPRDKLALVPYGVSAYPATEVQSAMTQRFNKSGKALRVFYAGEIGLRKGILDLCAAAERLNSQDFEFVAAGHPNLPEQLADRVHRRITILGKCTRAQIASEYAKADCFALPSYLEGSATVTYEALGWGLPVITTFAAGSVVENGQSGFVGDAGDIDFLAESLRQLREDQSLRERMSHAALLRSREFTVEKYGERLLAVLPEYNS
jgi:glycosyltransferase involved in cell wall biosynthesis